MNTQTRIALFLFVSNVLLILLFGLAIYFFQNKYSYNDFYKRLETRALIASKITFEIDRLNSETIRNLRELHLERLDAEKEYVLEYFADTSLKRITSQFGLPGIFLRNILANGDATHQDGNTFYSGHTVNSDGKKYLVIVSADNYYVSHHLSFLWNILWIGIVLIALVSITLSIYYSKTIFNPIKRIARQVRQITTENMHDRLPEEDNDNEISEVINTFNDLLNRMETAFEAQKNFISNASHEFSTPITTIIGEAEVSLSKERSAESYIESLKIILAQADRLDKITRSLVILAQTGYKGKRIEFEELRIDEVLWQIRDILKNLNPAANIVLDFSLSPEEPNKLSIKGNTELLHLAFGNIISNACKYSNNKPVTISVAASESDSIIIVKDEGIGIPDDEISKVYDPFFRASNTGGFAGYGIGLPLARNIIKLHGGSLKISSEVERGTLIQVHIPLARSRR